jgi:uncharacterized protein (DUF4415 family)
MNKVAKKWKLSPKARVIPEGERHELPPEAFEPRNTKVRITMYLDLDVVDYFKARAGQNGTPYQTQINTELRSLMEREQAEGPDAVRQLREATVLIQNAIRSVEKR